MDIFIQITVFCPPEPQVGAFFTGMQETSIASHVWSWPF